MAEVRFQDVKKSYGAVEVIDRLNLDIQDEEFMVLVGPSGCGKSTALRMIAGLEEITAGEVQIGGRVVNDLPPKDRDIAMVFQSYALYPHMTVRENLSFGLRIQKMPSAEIEERVNSAAEILGITNLLDRLPKALSGGQRQRVAVGRAIVRKPSVFLFDEPLSNLDAKLRVQMRAEITKLQRRLKTTTVYVTHDQVEAMTMGDRIAILKDGDLQQVGSPLEVYRDPANTFVASFIGTPPMNLLAGELVDGGEKVRGQGFELPVPEALRQRAVERGAEKVTVGIRPEFLVAPEEGEAVEGPSLRIEVEVVEPLGHESIVHGKVGNEFVTATMNPLLAPKAGETAELQVELEGLHLFDGESDERI